MNKNLASVLIFGFALFSSFFGAGNLIFPPAIGLAAGESWFLALLGFVVSGVLLPVCAFLAVFRSGGTEEGVAKEMGRAFAVTFGTMIMFSGVFIAIPRTAGTTYEIGTTSLLGEIPPLYSALVFFIIVLYFVINQSTAIEKLGKYITPFLVVMMGIIVVKGIFSPIGTPLDMGIANAFRKGFTDGYQTLDLLGGFLFSGAIIAAIIGRGYDTSQSQIRIVAGCAAVTCLGLIFVYGGLLYIGATGSAIFEAGTERTALLVGLIRNLLQETGHYILAFAVIFACLTTAIGATTGISLFFSRVSNGVLSYKVNAVATCLIGLFLSTNNRVDEIVSYAVPFLLIMYPVAIVLVFLAFCKASFINRGTYLGAVYGTLLLSVIETLPMFGLTPEYATRFIQIMPFSHMGFAWTLPALICGGVGTFAYKKFTGDANA
jgi:LIVCS family branched-chain amino acid:cation transporter